MPKVKLDDISLYYEIYGDGPPLLLIAGLGSDSSSWLGVVKEFSSIFKTIIFDNRGSGRSDIPSKACPIAQFVFDAVRLLDFLEIKKSHIIGHSMGGYVAQEFAIRYPERIDKLILESTAPVSSQRNNILFEDFFKQLERDGNIEAWIQRWTFWLFSRKRFLDTAFINAFVKNATEYPYFQQVEGFKGQIEAIASFDARDKIATIKAKTLIIEGEEDILIVPAEAETLAKSIPGSLFRLLEDTAHCIHIENPGLFTKVALEFLNSKTPTII